MLTVKRGNRERKKIPEAPLRWEDGESGKRNGRWRG